MRKYLAIYRHSRETLFSSSTSIHPHKVKHISATLYRVYFIGNINGLTSVVSASPAIIPCISSHSDSNHCFLSFLYIFFSLVEKYIVTMQTR